MLKSNYLKYNKKGEIMEKTNTKRNTVIGVCLFAVIFGALLALATVFDLRVSEILVRLDPGAYFTNSVFGAVFECIGSWPVYLFLSIAFACIYTNTKRSKNKPLRILGSIASNIASVVCMYILVTDTVGYAERHADIEGFTSTVFAKIVFVFVSVAFGELICNAFSKVDDKTAKALLKYSFIIIFAAAFANIIVNVIKNIMCRPRYRTMNFLGDTEHTNFHRWYQKFTMPSEDSPLYIASANGHKVGKDAYRSFPSGHTCAAATTYTLLALPHLFKKYNTVKMKALLYFVSVAVTATVAISRIVCGAHFFSDVLVGGTAMFIGVMLAIKIFIRKDYERV